MPQNVKYELRVVEIGEQVSEFIAHGVLVFFKHGVPPELADFSIQHQPTALHQPVAPGDTIWIDKDRFKVLAVGDVVNTNIANLGHMVLKCNGLHEPEMPGDICVESKPLPPIKIGTIIKVKSGKN
jgi:PTS system glucitol/sorbitol-specific IIA component